ncbi:hypothetical protein ACJZTR_03865 [Neorickettsia risticii]|uniref:Uncharacterized protein n=1 Tax=Neorickettsia risticii (strain Illinois) TaxID=434131 RepID=C6V640_NEORI|nr:hypothetical protein [Neorickettsia risticii]ACT69848.1 conserved hypothetical protein [Neorickettsia risticii str. Illinois]
MALCSLPEQIGDLKYDVTIPLIAYVLMLIVHVFGKVKDELERLFLLETTSF